MSFLKQVTVVSKIIKFKHFLKNLIIFLPFINIDNINDNLNNFFIYLITFTSLSIVAQGVYMYNDFKDEFVDANKKFNTFKYYKTNFSSEKTFKILVALLFLTGSLIILFFKLYSILLIIIFYIVLNIIYTNFLKKFLFLSLITLLTFYNIRIFIAFEMSQDNINNYIFQIYLLNLIFYFFLILKKEDLRNNSKLIFFWFILFFCSSVVFLFLYELKSYFIHDFYLYKKLLIILLSLFFFYDYLKLSKSENFNYDIMNNLVNVKYTFLILLIIMLYVL